MAFDLYNLFLAISKIRTQRLGFLGVRIFFAYARLRLKLRFLTWFAREVRTENFLGFRFNFFNYRTFVYLIEEIFVNGIYHFRTDKLDPLIFDCGSNIGVTVLYFKLLYPLSRIVAFEPGQRTFAMLKGNVENNGLAGVSLHNLALSDLDGEITFHSETLGSLGASVVSGRERSDGASPPTEVVRCRALSGLIEKPIDFMKMDIEGAELLCIPEVAKSGRLQQVKELVIECHHNIGGSLPILTKVLSTLETSGFVYQIGSAARPHAAKSSSQDVMVYAGRTESAAL